MMEAMGIGENDVSNSRKIVVIGTSVEVHHDYKQTPFIIMLNLTLTPEQNSRKRFKR